MPATRRLTSIILHVAEEDVMAKVVEGQVMGEAVGVAEDVGGEDPHINPKSARRATNDAPGSLRESASWRVVM